MSDPHRADWGPGFFDYLRRTGKRLVSAERAGVRESTVRKRIKYHLDFAIRYHETVAAFHEHEAEQLRSRARALERVISGDADAA